MKIIYITILASLATSSALAASPKIFSLPAGYSWVGSISAGPTWEHAGQAQTFYLTSDTQKTYTASRPTDILPQGQVFVGIQKILRDHIIGQLGLNLVVTGSANPKGNIWDDANAAFNNYTYSYKINHRSLDLKGKLLVDNGYWFIPWFSASIGVGCNNAYSYGNSPTIFEAVANANFTSNTTTAVTYSLGIGAQRVINQNWQAGLGYEFSDWGKSQLGRAAGQTMNQGLTLNHLYTNSIIFNITYVS